MAKRGEKPSIPSGIKAARGVAAVSKEGEARARRRGGGPPLPRKRLGWQERRILEAVRKIFPPDGVVPDSVASEDVRAEVNTLLHADNRNRGLRDVSRDSVDRVIGRRPR